MLTTLRITLGIVFVILGIVGSLLPVLQGWMFFAVAILLLFPNHPFVESMLCRIERRSPRVSGWLRKLGVGVAGTPKFASLNLSAKFLGEQPPVQLKCDDEV